MAIPPPMAGVWQEPPVRAHRERCTWPVSDDTTTGTEGTAPPPGGPAKDGARSTGPVLESHYRFLLWLVPAVKRFPRSRKFLLGDRIQRTALDVLEALIDATCTRQRTHHLARANLGIEKLRFLFRLAHDSRVGGRPGGPGFPEAGASGVDTCPRVSGGVGRGSASGGRCAPPRRCR